MMESEQTAELAAALAKAQAAMGPAIINRVGGPPAKNRYADLSSVFAAIKPLHDNGLAITQSTQFRDGAFLLRTTLRHVSGQWVAADYPLPLNAKPQEIGSALTYARRYSISALTGVVADEDDDGAEAMRKTTNGGNGKHVEETGELVSTADIEKIQKRIVALGADITAFCKHMKVARIADIPASEIDKATAALDYYENAHANH